MKLKFRQYFSKFVIPDGEGFTALPIYFNPHPFPSPRPGEGCALER